MPNTREIIEQIIKVRGRRRSASAMAELFNSLRPLENAFKKREDLPIELHKYFPVVLVPSLESFLRLVIKELVGTSCRWLAKDPTPPPLPVHSNSYQHKPTKFPISEKKLDALI